MAATSLELLEEGVGIADKDDVQLRVAEVSHNLGAL